MATTTVTRSADVKKLQNTIITMDALAREGFEAISAVAVLAIGWLETPDAHRSGGDPLTHPIAHISKRLSLLGEFQASSKVGHALHADP
jgi:hypothetical protein